MNQDNLKIPNAPIVEAVFNIQTVGGAPLTEDLSNQIKERLQAEYPTVQAVKEAEITVSIENGNERVNRIERLKGFQAHSQDEKQIVQYNSNNFTFNRLKPYDSCEVHLREAMILWDFYANLTNPTSTSRITLRNINQIKLNDYIQLADLFEIHPERAQIAGLDRKGFNLQAQFVDKTSKAKCNIILVQRDSDIMDYFLDIEVYLDVQESDNDNIAQHFKTLQKLKNRIFTGALTPKGIEILKKL